MKVEELLPCTLTDAKNLNQLMHELFSTSYCNEAILNAIIEDENSHAYKIHVEGQIVVAGTLCVIHTLEFTNAYIGSVVVSSNLRRQGLGKLLAAHMINEAQSNNVHSIHLTSNPKRVLANYLYQSVGFVKYETNCYVLNL